MELTSIMENVAFQPTLPVRGVTMHGERPRTWVLISTHTPRAGSDGQHTVQETVFDRISTHTPRAGSDLEILCLQRGKDDFNPHSPCGE